MEPRRIPVFATEAEEARWWYDNREELSEDWEPAAKAGRLGIGSKARWEQMQREHAAAEGENLTARKAS